MATPPPDSEAAHPQQTSACSRSESEHSFWSGSDSKFPTREIFSDSQAPGSSGSQAPAWVFSFPSSSLGLLVPKLQLGSSRSQAPAWERNGGMACFASWRSEASRTGRSPSWSLGTRSDLVVPDGLGTRGETVKLAEAARKPGSVPAAGYPEAGDGHSSRSAVADALKQPTRKHGRAVLNASLFGLAPGGVYLASGVAVGPGELLPHPFTLTRLR